MNLTKPVLGTLAVMFFLLSSSVTYAQVTSFVAESQAVSILNTEKASAETELSALVQSTPTLQNQDLQAYATALEAAKQAYRESQEALQFKISVSDKLLLEIAELGSPTDAVKYAVVSLLEKLENTTIDANTYAYAAQNLTAYGSEVNDYVLSLLGE